MVQRRQRLTKCEVIKRMGRGTLFLTSLIALINPAFAQWGKWTEELEFVYETHGHKIRTGEHGNVALIEQVGQSVPSSKKFSVAAIHTELMEKSRTIAGEASPSNIVTAGLTVIVKYGQRFEACYKNLSEETKHAAFLSGGTESTLKSKVFTVIGSSKDYPPGELSNRFDERLLKNISKLDPSPIIECQTTWKEGVKQTWKTVQAGLQRVSDSINPDDPDAKKKFESHYTQEINGPLGTTTNFGSAIDSEQFLLKYLTKKEDETRIEGAYDGTFGKHQTLKAEALKHQLPNAKIDEEEKFVEETRNYLQALRVGYILHLHSTNEVCSCCAYSLASDLLYGEIPDKLKDMVTKHNEGKPGAEEIDPFFLILVSANQKMNEPEGETEYYRRVGIGEDSRLKDKDYETAEGQEKWVKANSAISQKVFLQKIMRSSQSSTQ